MDIADKKVAIVVANYFEEAEFTEPLRALKDAGARVEVVGATTKALQALHHADKVGQYQADILLVDANPDAYDALVLPGGVINADHLRMEQRLHDWVAAFLDDEKIVAAICHAPWVLVSAGVLHGRTLTSYETIQDDIRNAGGTWENLEVVIDRTLITSRRPSDIPAFNDAIINMLQEN